MEIYKKYKGVFPAFYACYDENGDISPQRVKTLTQYYIDKGVNGLYVGGSSGECVYQNVQERKTTLESVMQVAKGKITIIAHVASSNTRDSKELAAHAESLDVDAISTLPPIYYPLPEKAIVKYWQDIALSAPNTDFIIYNIPQLTGVSLTKSMHEEMLKNPKVIGIKNTSMAAVDIQIFKATGGKDYIVFNGPDEQFIAGRAMGATGGIGGTYGAMPELFVKLNQLFDNNEMQKAYDLQSDINEVIFKMISRSNMYAVAKGILKQRGVNIGTVRNPLHTLQEGDEEIVNFCVNKIDATIKKFNM